MSTDTIHVFVSYSRADSMWVQDGPTGLIPWLAQSLERDRVQFWFDPELKNLPGADYKAVIKEEIDKADFALLLISQDFVNSKFITDYELPWIKERVSANEQTLIPILVSPVSQDDLGWLTYRQIIPGKPTPLIDYVSDPARFKRVRVEILDAIRHRVRGLRRGQSKAKEPEHTAPTAAAVSSQRMDSRFGKPRHLWINAVIAAAAVLLVLAGAVFLLSLTGFRATRGLPLPPPVTSRDIEAMAAKVLAIASDCRRDPSVLTDKRIELQQMGVKVSAEPRYREDALGATAALYRLVAAAMFLQPTGRPNREHLKEGLFWLEKLRELSPTLQNDSQLKETADFFFAFVEGRTPTWDVDGATRHAVQLALLGDKETDIVKLSKRIADRAKESEIHEVKILP